MLLSLERLVAEKVGDPDRFWDDCYETFTSPAGARVLEIINTLAGLRESPLRSNSEETHVMIGRQEMAHLLSNRTSTKRTHAKA